MFAETKTTGQALQVNHPAHEKQDKKKRKATAFLFGDPDRIQTCNLLIRSQMLYSVELRDRVVFV